MPIIQTRLGEFLVFILGLNIKFGIPWNDFTASQALELSVKSGINESFERKYHFYEVYRLTVGVVLAKEANKQHQNQWFAIPKSFTMRKEWKNCTVALIL